MLSALNTDEKHPAPTHGKLKNVVFIHCSHPRSCDELCSEKQPEAQEVLTVMGVGLSEQ